MKRSATIAGAILVLAITGCATKPPPPPPKQEVYLEEIPYGSTENVRTGEIVKAYPIARWIDPANKNLMHERSVIYRLERSSSWRLKTPPGTEDATLLGPVAGVRKPYYAPAPTAAELSRELQKQRAVSATLDARLAQINQTAQQDTAKSQAERQKLEELLRAQDELQRDLKNRLSSMEAKISSNTAEIQSMQRSAPEAQQTRSSGVTPGPVEDSTSAPAPSAPLTPDIQ